MNASELRIGNCIYHCNKAKIIYVTHRIISDIASEDSLPYQPVHLTEEILVKAGFEDYFGGYYKFHDFGINYSNTNNTFKIACNGKIVFITSLHHLQNLYHAIRGEELQINL